MTTFANPPAVCDTCRKPFKNTLFDARMRNGQWACLCKSCFAIYGWDRLGTGYGQCYKKGTDGKFHKIAG